MQIKVYPALCSRRSLWWGLFLGLGISCNVAWAEPNPKHDSVSDAAVHVLSSEPYTSQASQVSQASQSSHASQAEISSESQNARTVEAKSNAVPLDGSATGQNAGQENTPAVAAMQADSAKVSTNSSASASAKADLSLDASTASSSDAALTQEHASDNIKPVTKPVTHNRADDKADVADVTASLESVTAPGDTSYLEGAGQNKFGNVRASSGGSHGPLTEGLNSPMGILQWMLSTVGVLVCIFVLAYFFKKSRFVQRAVGTMQIESQVALGQKERLMKVKIDNRHLLLGVTTNSINLILDLDSASASTLQNGREKYLKAFKEDLDASLKDTLNSNDPGLSKISSAYQSAKAAYELKQYEALLTHLTEVAASSAAAAAVAALQSANAGSPVNADNLSPVSSQAVSENGQAHADEVSGSSEVLGAVNPSDSQPNGNAADSNVGNVASANTSVDNFDNAGGASFEVQEKASVPHHYHANVKAIVEPHANEAHNIANHFSSEHTIVRASKSTQFMNSQFGIPPDREVLHARAKRAKSNARALELEVEPQPKDPYRPRSEQVLRDDESKTLGVKDAALNSSALSLSSSAKQDESSLFRDFSHGKSGHSSKHGHKSLDSLKMTGDFETSKSKLKLESESKSQAESKDSANRASANAKLDAPKLTKARRGDLKHGAEGEFGQVFTHAWHDLAQGKPSQKVLSDTPWVAEDDLAEAAEQQKKR